MKLMHTTVITQLYGEATTRLGGAKQLRMQSPCRMPRGFSAGCCIKGKKQSRLRGRNLSYGLGFG